MSPTTSEELKFVQDSNLTPPTRNPRLHLHASSQVLLSLLHNFAVWPNKVVVPTTTWAYMFVGYVPEQVS